MTKRATDETDETNQAGAPSPAAQKPNRAAAKERLQPRISIPLDASRRPKFDTMANKTRDALREWLQDPAVQAELQIAPPAPAAAAPGDEPFPVPLAATIYDALGVLSVGLLRAKGVPAEALAVIPFTEQEKGALAPITARLFDKYLPGGISKYTDEVILAVTLGQIVAAKFAAVKQILDKMAANQVGTMPTPANPADVAAAELAAAIEQKAAA